MTTVKKSIGLLALFFIINPTNLLRASERIPLLYMAGGFASCPDQNVFSKIAKCVFKPGLTEQMGDQIDRFGLIEKLKDKYGVAPRFFYSCYSDFDPLDAENIFLRFGRLRKLESKQAGPFIGKLENNGIDYNVEKYQHLTQVNIKQTPDNAQFVDPLVSQLEREIKKIESESGKKVDLYLFGHSYGGFTVMQTAWKLITQKGIDIKGLNTIDPISPLNCMARTMVFDPIGTLTKTHAGCKMAPNDINSVTAREFLQNYFEESLNGWWYHVFQSDFPFLQSGAILTIKEDDNGRFYFLKYPESREFKKYPFDRRDGDPHSQLGRLDALWNDVFSNYVLRN